MNIRSRILGGSESGPSLLKTKQPKGVRSDELHSIPVTRHEGRRGDTRQEDRHRLEGEAARVTHNGTSVDVDLINVSGGGAMVCGPFEPMLRDKLELRLGTDGTIECAVLWIRDGRIGLEFAHETRLDCSDKEQAEVLRDVISRSFPDLQLESSTRTAAESDHRWAPRHPMIWSGLIHHDFQSTAVRVRNISATGAMVESSVPVSVGSEPVLELSDEVTISCTVAWAIGDQLGLRFHNPFDITMLAKSRPNVKDRDADSCWNHSSLSELKHELEGFLKR